MSSFEVFLLSGSEAAVDPAPCLEAILASGRVDFLRDDPARGVYRNPDTGVNFSLVLGPPLVALLQARLARARAEETGEIAEEGEPSGEEEEGDPSLEQEDEEEEEHDEDGEEASLPMEAPPLVLSLPLVCPSFFCREALAFAETVARAAGLHLEHTEPLDAAGGGSSPRGGSSTEEKPPPAAMSEKWDCARREMVRGLIERHGGRLEIVVQAKVKVESVALTAWPPEKVEAWWNYGQARAGLRQELEKEGVRVPILQAVYHQDRVKTLCQFLVGSPSVLPPTDLVLLRKESERKGFFRTRKVAQEWIVEGPALRGALEPVSERRSLPVDLLIVRGGADLPGDLADRLEALPREPLEAVRRASLLGVLDFEPHLDLGPTSSSA